MRKPFPLVLLVFVLLLAACGPAMKPSVGPQTESGEVFLLALPRLVVDIDANGQPSALGVKLEDLGRLVGQDFSGYRLDKFYVDWMTAANVQHIELRQTGDGLALVVNGIPMPHIAWTDASLQRASEVAALFNTGGDQVMTAVKKLLPVVRRLGLDVVIKFPLRSDAKAIPLADPSVAMAPAKPDKSDPVTMIYFEVKYDGNGVPAILGISAQELVAWGLLDPNQPVALGRDAILALQARNIQYLELRTKPDGLFIYVNGEPLPNLVWDNTLLTNAGELYAQMNPTSEYVELIKQLAPNLDNLDMAVLVHFPLAAGAKAIEIKRH